MKSSLRSHFVFATPTHQDHCDARRARLTRDAQLGSGKPGMMRQHPWCFVLLSVLLMLIFGTRRGLANEHVQFVLVFGEDGTRQFQTKTGGNDGGLQFGLRTDPTDGAKNIPAFFYKGNISENTVEGDVVINEPNSGITDVLRFAKDPKLGKSKGANEILFYSDKETNTTDPIELKEDVGLPGKIDPNAQKICDTATNPQRACDEIDLSRFAKNPASGQIAITLGNPENLINKTGAVYLARATKKGGSPGSAQGDPDVINVYIIISDSDVVKNVKAGTTGGDKNPKKAPTGLPSGNPTMSYDATTQTLSFTDGKVNFLNVKGDQSNDPQFGKDPLLGATIKVGNFTLLGERDSGYVFGGGSLMLIKENRVLLDAQIPYLLIDDSGKAVFDGNVFAPLYINNVDTFTSQFLSQYKSYALANLYPMEFFADTSIPVGDMIGENMSFTVPIDESFSTSYEPEPTAWLLLGGGWTVLIAAKRRLWKA